MPRLWDDTIEAHRRSVREATLDATAALVAERGLRGVTMSEIAQKTGIGRATLYKYFPDVETIVAAWHERQIDQHLTELAEVRDSIEDPTEQLIAFLTKYAAIQRQRAQHHRQPHGAELAALLHTDVHLAPARKKLHRMVTDLIEDTAAAGVIRDDIPVDELADYCLRALEAAQTVSSADAVSRLVSVTMAGIRRQA